MNQFAFFSLLLSYADYARIPPKDHCYDLAKSACEKSVLIIQKQILIKLFLMFRLTVKLNATEGEKWREKLPQDDNNDDERYLTYIKIKDKYTDNDQYQWYRNRGNQLYLDACFVLAIRCYTYCIELKPDIAFTYTSRAVCYLKVFEV
jgi:hypothetical protein